MTRAGLYARFSTELQNRRSSDDQLALLRAFCETKQWTPVKTYRDDAASGGSLYGRPDFARMVADAEAGLLDVLVAEDIERFSRNLGDVERFRERMEFAEVMVWSMADGEVTQLNATIKGLSSAIMLKGHAQRTRNRQGERAREGKCPGGLTYGYAPGASKGARLIVEHEAMIVRRIFADYVRGMSPRAIAAALNSEGVAPPRSGQWLASTIIGNVARGTGVLANALYDGRLVWNRVAMRKDPRNGKRVSRVNPQDQWIIAAVPHLRIVEPDVFAKAQALKAERSKVRPEVSRRPRHLLAGMLRCGCCGGFMSVNNVSHAGRRISCGRRKEGGTCMNARTYPLAAIERRVVEAMQAQLALPEGIALYLAAYQAERKKIAAGAASKRSRAERALAQAQKEIGQIVTAIGRETIGDAEARAALAPLRVRRDQFAAELASLAAPVKTVALHPATIETYLAAVRDLAETLSRRTVEGNEEIAQALRKLVLTVKVSPGPGGEIAIDVAGKLAAIAGGDLFPSARLSANVGSGGPTPSLSPQENEGIFRFAA